ncbi:MAG: hypothetical protein KAJ19_04785 [Gammaproteobacteria bacterium]|nr:hypothetical protein [Gammaproteobacteria bacterium]
MLEIILINSLLFGVSSYYLAQRHGIGRLFWTSMGFITGPLVVPFILLDIMHKHHHNKAQKFTGSIRIIPDRESHD